MNVNSPNKTSIVCIYVYTYVHMYIDASSFLVLHGVSNVKHSSAAVYGLAACLLL